jgi:hypothetical protein
MRVHSQERIASIVAAGGIIWAVKIASIAFYQMPVASFPLAPLEVCSAGVAMWLHAKWRRSIRLR